MLIVHSATRQIIAKSSQNNISSINQSGMLINSYSQVSRWKMDDLPTPQCGSCDKAHRCSALKDWKDQRNEKCSQLKSSPIRLCRKVEQYTELLYQLAVNHSNAADLFCLFKSETCRPFKVLWTRFATIGNFCPCDSSILSIHSFNRVWEIIWDKHERRCENQLMKLRILGKSTWNGHEVSTLNQRTALNREECHNKRWGNTRLQQLRTAVVGISWSAEPARIRRG